MQAHQNHVCAICGKDCHTRGGLGSHMKSAHPDQWVRKYKPEPKSVDDNATAPVKRQYRKREQQPAGIPVCFCPRCGFNLQILAAALAVAARHQNT